MRNLYVLPLLLAFAAAADDSIDKDYAEELPRFPPVEPQNALSTFEVMEGYKLELVAHEPLVMDPVAAAFDEYGRMFVVEMRGYSERREANEGGVVLLTDTDGDGNFDKRDQYVDGLAWPTAVTCWDGGVFVGVAPDILYCKDTDGDCKADLREVAFTGFGTSNVQGLLNSFQWTIDNRIHGATSSSGGNVRRPDQPESEALNLNGRDFSFDPRTREMRAESGGGQHGLTFDDWGRKYVCSNSDHIQQVMYEDRYLARAPWLAAPSPRVSIAADGPQAEVFRISPPEPWRVVRTRLRVQGIVPGPIEGGGRPAGYFTGATGTTIYLGDLMPELRGMAFVADIGGNLIHRKRLESVDGIQMRAVRVDEGREFIASRDTWFRPAQFVNGPEGALYILDVYREIIEHPDSLPPVIKKHLDLNSGHDRGRIYRVVPAYRQPSQVRKLDPATVDELIEALKSPNAWTHETAMRLLYQRQEKELPEEIHFSEPDPIVHARNLGVLRGLSPEPTLTPWAGEYFQKHASLSAWMMRKMDFLSPNDLISAFKINVAPSAIPVETGERNLLNRPALIMQALRLSEWYRRDNAVNEAALAVAQDNSPAVMYQLAFSAGAFSEDIRNQILSALIPKEATNKWLTFALQTSLGPEPMPVLTALLKESPGDEHVLAFAAETAVTASGGDAEKLRQLIADAQAAAPDPEGKFRGRIVQRLIRSGRVEDARGLYADEAYLTAELARARELVMQQAAPIESRLTLIELLSLDEMATLQPILARLLAPTEPAEIQAAVLQVLQWKGAEVTPAMLLEAWPALAPANATRAIEILYSRPVWLLALLEAVEQKKIPATALTAARKDAARNHGDARVKEKAIALFAQGTGRRENLEELLGQVQALAGDAARGQVLFTENCAQCHKYRDVGHEVGPDLAAAVSAGAEKLITNILDPNLEVDPRYNNYLIDTTDFESHSGIIAAETANSVTLKRANGDSNTILREQIETMRNSELSIMPENWDETIGMQGIADVVAFLEGK